MKVTILKDYLFLSSDSFGVWQTCGPKGFIFKMTGVGAGTACKIPFDPVVPRYTDVLGWNFCDCVIHLEKGFPFYYQRKRLC